MQFYKFTPISRRIIISLVTGKFWASSLSKMNDPFEDRFINDKFKNLVDSFGVFSMSRFDSEQNNILTKPLMWAHYSKNHMGIAIGLKHQPPSSHPFKVEYMDENEIKDQFKTLLKHYKGKVGKEISPWAEIFFKYKPKFWEYENEYRQVHVAAANKYVDPKLEINEIVFGYKSSPEDEIAIWCALREKIKYKKAININGELVIKPYQVPTQIETSNRYLLSLDTSDVDLNSVEEVKNINTANYKFK